MDKTIYCFYHLDMKDINLDRTDRHLLALLQSDSRLTYEELGEAVGLSAPATYQRVRKLEAGGVITGYHARVAPESLDRGVLVFLRVEPGAKTDVGKLALGWESAGEVLECHRLTGAYGYLLKLRVGDVSRLQPHLDAVRKAGGRVAAELGIETLFERWTLPTPS
jgi:Lrp/AsnC family leucine-responsive transcriptional regulator